MKTYRKKRFFGINGESVEVKDAAFLECEFIGCAAVLVAKGGKRNTFRSLTVSGGRAHNCLLEDAIVEDCIIDSLDIGELFRTWGTVYRHVVLRGPIRGWFSAINVPYDYRTPAVRERVVRANADYYGSVDWALDIRDAEFEGADIEGIPAHLLRLDPETQAVAKRARLEADEGWRKCVKGTVVEEVISTFLRRQDDPAILVAPKFGSEAKEYLRALKALRRAGYVEE